jgi:hypothetical protein
MKIAFAPPILFAVSLAACEAVSGLDQLEVCDACGDVDATGDTSTSPDASDASNVDSTSPDDASSPDVADTLVIDASDASTKIYSCFQTECGAGQVCCLSSSGQSAACHLPSCPLGTYELDCTLPSDCPGSHCCANIPSEQVQGASCNAQCQNILCVNTSLDSGCAQPDDCVNMDNLPAAYGICF